MSLSTSEILKPLKKTRSREVLDVKALGFALIIHFCSILNSTNLLQIKEHYIKSIIQCKGTEKNWCTQER